MERQTQRYWTNVRRRGGNDFNSLGLSGDQQQVTIHSVAGYYQMLHKQFCILTETELIIVKLHKFQKSYTCKQLQPSIFFLTNVSIIVRDLEIYSGISKMSGSVLYLVTSNKEDWLIFPRIVKKET